MTCFDAAEPFFSHIVIAACCRRTCGVAGVGGRTNVSEDECGVKIQHVERKGLCMHRGEPAGNAAECRCAAGAGGRGAQAIGARQGLRCHGPPEPAPVQEQPERFCRQCPGRRAPPLSKPGSAAAMCMWRLARCMQGWIARLLRRMHASVNASTCRHRCRVRKLVSAADACVYIQG